ncbi:MAG: tetratricopeptide repeat protein, partial [Nannocystaceae bacterium]
IPTTTSPVQTNQFAGEDYVDVDQIATAPARAEASHGSRRIDEVREEIRRSQLDVGATGSGGSIGGEMDGGVAQLAGRADAILEEADDTHLMETHTDPYPPPDESADFSDLNEDLSTEGLEAFIEQSSGFAKSAPVLTGPLAEESLAGYAVVDVEAQLESRHESRSRSESGVIRGDLGASGRDVEAVDRASQPVKINREMTLTREPPLAVDVTHASPSGLRGRTLSESGADFDRLRTLAGIETDTVPIRSGHRPAYESTRASIPAQNEAAPSPNEEAELPPRPLPPRERTQTRVGLPPPGAVNVGNKSADPVAEDPAPAPTASTSRGGIPRELPTGDLAPSESMVATLSSGPSWWRRNWIYVIFGAALALVGFLFSGSDRALVNRGVVTDGTTGGSGNAASPDPSADASVNPSADASADASEGAPEEASNVAAEMESSSSSTTGTGAGSDATEATDTDATDESRASVETGGDGEPGTDSSAAEPSEGEAAVAVNDSVDAATPSMVEVGEGSEAGGSVEASSAPVADDSTTGAPETTPTAEEAFESAKELFDRGKYGDASEEIDRALALDSGWPEALLLRGKIHLERGEFEEAMGQARKVTLVAPGLVEAHIVIGVAEEALGSKEGAIAAYQRFLLVAPDHVYATSIRKELKRLGAEPPP